MKAINTAMDLNIWAMAATGSSKTTGAATDLDTTLRDIEKSPRLCADRPCL